MGKSKTIFPLLILLAIVGTLLSAPFSLKSVTVVKGGGYFPVVIRLESNEVLVVLRGGGAHLGRGGRLDMVMSRDSGRTWSKPKTVVDGPEDDRNPALGQLKDGTILLAFAILSGYEVNGQRLSPRREDRIFDGVYITRSQDKGKTWTKPQRDPRIYSFYNGKGAVSPYGKIIQLKDGTVIMAVYFEFFDGRGNESYLFRSRDGGKTWGEPSLIGKHYNETALLELKDGSLLAAMRSEPGGHIAVTHSLDGGNTWSNPVQVTEDNEHPADLILLQNGAILMTYGVRNAPRGVQGILSWDGGKNWDMEHKFILNETAANVDCGYPSSVEVAKNMILTLYYQVDDLNRAPQSARCSAIIWKIPE